MNDGGSAFPNVQSVDGNGRSAAINSGPDPDNVYIESSGGMSLRDYFAAKALQGILASIVDLDMAKGVMEAADKAGVGVPAAHANMAYAIADAMLSARDSKQNK